MSQEVFDKVPYKDVISMACYEALGKPMVSEDGRVFYPKGWLRFLGITAEELLSDEETQ